MPPSRAARHADSVSVLARYDRASAPAVLAAKNGARLDVIRQLGRLLAAEVDRSVRAVDVVCWVPASQAGRRARGYDQGRELARVVARRLGAPARSLLERPRHDVPQGDRDGDGRRLGPDLKAKAAGRSVVVLDDVITTGASMGAAVAALRQAGSTSVHVAAVTAV